MNNKKSSKMKPFLMGVILLVVILAIAIAVGEIYARCNYNRCYLTGIMTKNSVFHHLPPPYYNGEMYSENDFDVSYTTNNRGMRGPGDYSYQKKTGVYRIALMGDSFAFGVGVKSDETMAFLLEKMLNERREGSYQIYNFGVSSFSPVLEYIYLKEEVIKYNPDLVVLMLDISDVQDDYYREPHLVYDNDKNIIGCNPMVIGRWPDIRAYLMYYSRFFNLLDRTILQSLRKMRALGLTNYFSNKFKGVRNKAEIFKNKDIDNIYFDKFLMFREGKNKKIVMQHWKRTEIYLTMIKEYLDQKNVPLIVIIYPYGHQVGEKQWQRGRNYWAFTQNTVYDPSEGFAIMEGFAKKMGISMINLYPALRKRKNEALYFDSDGHWTALGQRIAAEAVYDSGSFSEALKRLSDE
ncbi:MAG: hypothetical protein HQ579_02600 [Candidatus Omnitrophica bacterium]|nr:hypothetical protein [Candidatus Omnitrophota bacterium]